MQRPNLGSATAALQVLELFTQRKLTLTGDQFEERFDRVLAALEAANDEKYRLEYQPDDQTPEEV